MIQVGFLLILCIAVVTANPPCLPACKAASNFDAEKFEGIWYEVRNIASAPNREGTCETATCAANVDKTLYVDLDWFDTAGNPKNLKGKIKTSKDKPTDALLTVTFGEKSALYTIFYLNYDTMFGVYTCIDKKAYVWVFAKTQEVANGALKDLNIAMKDSGLNPKSLKPTPRKGCQGTY